MPEQDPSSNPHPEQPAKFNKLRRIIFSLVALAGSTWFIAQLNSLAPDYNHTPPLHQTPASTDIFDQPPTPTPHIAFLNHHQQTPQPVPTAPSPPNR